MIIRTFNFFTRTAPWLEKAILPNITGMLSRNAGRPLVNHMLNMVLLLRGSVTPSYVRVVISYVRFLVHLYRHGGTKFVVIYLKAATIILMQVVSGQVERFPPQSFGAAVARTRSGLPRLIPKAHRALIRGGSSFHIRFWLTMLSLYRVLEFRGVLKISTIIRPGPVVPSNLHRLALKAVADLSSHHVFTLGEFSPFEINSRGSTSQPLENKAGSPRCAASHPRSVLNAIAAHHGIMGQWGLVHPWLKVIVTLGNALTGRSPLITSFWLSLRVPLMNLLPTWINSVVPDLGRLSYKEEPAGKIRVFAMVDPFTQWMLKPLHVAIFGLLRSLRQDATFDQLGKVRQFSNDLRLSGIRKVYSFDLTAATDRLPLSLQVTILSYFLGPRVASAWGEFLVDRWYSLPSPLGDPTATLAERLGCVDPDPNVRLTPSKMGVRVTAVRYATGQPMGALSSWAILALTHHVIIWMAAYRAGVSPRLILYLILGDDMVVADSAVAHHYLVILKELGAPVNMTKSICSTNGSFEFAKRFVVDGVDVSPISWKEMFMSRIDVRALLQLVNKESHLRLSSILGFMGHGYRAISRAAAEYRSISRSMGRLLLYLSIPESRLSTMSSQTRWLLSSSFNSYKGHGLENSVRTWILGVILNRITRVRFPQFVRNEYSLLQVLKKVLLAEDSDRTLTWFSSRLYTHVWEPIRDTYVYGDAEARGEALRLMAKAKSLPISRGEAVLDALDVLFAFLYKVEDSLSSRLTTDVFSWIDVKDVITLNRCRELRWADLLRSQHPRLSVTLTSPRKPTRRGGHNPLSPDTLKRRSNG
nr:MAG: RNA-dependent RNA polymerase [Mitovirus sp.]